MGYYTFRYVLTIPYILLVSLIFGWASFNIKRLRKKYSDAKHGLFAMSGGQLAKKIIADNGLDVELVIKEGFLCDYYDAKHRVVCLSSGTYYGRTIPALATAAHEVGHAIQHKRAYMPLLFKNIAAPVANLSSHVCIPLIVIGLWVERLARFYTIGMLLLAFYLLILLLITVVERNASKRALKEIEKQGFFDRKQMKKAKRFLKAAAFTYDASFLTAIVKMLRTKYILTGA